MCVGGGYGVLPPLRTPNRFFSPSGKAKLELKCKENNDFINIIEFLLRMVALGVGEGLYQYFKNKSMADSFHYILHASQSLFCPLARLPNRSCKDCTQVALIALEGEQKWLSPNIEDIEISRYFL